MYMYIPGPGQALPVTLPVVEREQPMQVLLDWWAPLPREEVAQHFPAPSVIRLQLATVFVIESVIVKHTMLAISSYR